MRKIFNIIIIIFFVNSCGFKIAKQSNLENFYIAEIKTDGDKKVNYIIKNYLLNFKKNENNRPLNLNLKTKKIKSIREKNIKNEITKYQIEINITVEFKKNIDDKDKLVISKTGEYLVSKQFSQTISNEKKLIQVLTENISEEIILQLSEKLNDI